MDLPRHTGPRVVLLVALAFGVVSLSESLNSNLLGANFRVYRTAAEAAFAGQSMYGVSPPGLPSTYSYLYPPITVVAFLPFILLPWQAGFAVFTLFSLGTGAALAVFCGRYVERTTPLSGVDYALLVGFTLLSPLAAPSLVYGNVNVILTAVVGAGFMACEVDTEGSRRVAGVALAVPASTKLFPVGFAWWYVRERATTALAWAVGVAVAALLVGLLVFGVDAHATYVETAVLPRLAGTAGAGESYVTIRRPLSAVLDPTAVTPVAAFLLGGVVLTLTAGPLSTRDERLLALCGTVAAAVVFVPSYPLYLLYLAFPLLPALYLVEDRIARPLVHLGALLLVVTVQAGDLPRVAAATGVGGVTALEPLFSVATPPLLGVFALLLAGVVVRAR